MKNKLLLLGRTLKDMLSRNVGLKLLSLIFAFLLWSYVIYSNPSITSDMTLTGIEVATSGQSVLKSRNLALLTDVSKIDPVNVRVQVSQANYSNVTPDNVRVELDLTGIRQAGKQSVKLRGSSTTGRVVQISPESAELEVEELDERYTPVMIELVGKSDKYWYNPSSINPAYITLGGPASIMREVSSAWVICDVSRITSTFRRNETFILRDSNGNELSSATLSKSTSSVSVAVDVYPQKQLSITSNISELITGELPEGYEVTNVVVQPESIFIAGEKSLLDGMRELAIEPVDVTGQKSTFNKICKINLLDNFKNKSSDQVTVTVNIGEKTITERFIDIPVLIAGKSDSTEAKLSQSKVGIRATGLYSVIRDSLKKGDLIASVDVTDLAPGEYDLPVQVTVDNYPDISFVPDPETIRVSIR